MRPRAHQTVSQVKSGKRAGTWEVLRYVDCPTHSDARGKPQRSTEFLGPVEEGWEFRCKENDKHMQHRIVALAPLRYPKTPEEAFQWFRDEVARMVVAPTKSQS